MIARYLDEMEAPRPMIDAMVVTDSSNIWWVDADGDHLEQPPTYAEWAEAACGHFSKQEENSLQNLLHKQSSGNLTGNDALLLQLLSIQHPARSRELNIGTSNLDASNGDRSKGSLRDPLWLRPGPAVIVEGDTSTIVPFVISVIHKIAHFSLHTAARRSRPHPSRGRHCGHRMKTAVQL